MTTVVVASIGPLLLFLTAIVTLYIQQRNLRKENEKLRDAQDSRSNIQLINTFRDQAQTNYQAALRAEENRQNLYEKYLILQEKYAEERAKNLGLDK